MWCPASSTQRFFAMAGQLCSPCIDLNFLGEGLALVIGDHWIFICPHPGILRSLYLYVHRSSDASISTSLDPWSLVSLYFWILRSWYLHIPRSWYLYIQPSTDPQILESLHHGIIRPLYVYIQGSSDICNTTSTDPQIIGSIFRSPHPWILGPTHWQIL